MTNIRQFKSVFELRSSLRELLTKHPRVLGEFTEGEHANIDAIWVSPPDPPSGVKGIRCLIPRTPEASSTPAGSRQIMRSEYWLIRLTNFDSKSKLMAEAKLRVESSFLMPDASTRQAQYIAPTGSTFEETLIWIWRPVAIDRKQFT